MDNKVEVNLGHVQKTLFLPLWGRALESKKGKPLLRDQTAVRIIEQVDYDFAPMTQNLDELSQIAWIKRALICDRVIKQFLEKYPDGTIVNIGCGLDTTFERIDNGRLNWIDLDLADVIKLRSTFIQPSQRRQFVAASFLETDWLKNIKGQENVLFMAAGVLYYFQEEEIKAFVKRLIALFPNSQLLFDVCSPFGMRVANKKVVESSGLDEKSYLTWGLKNKNDLLAWDERIKIIGVYHYFRSLNMSLRNIIMGTLSDLAGIQYMLHLQL